MEILQGVANKKDTASYLTKSLFVNGSQCSKKLWLSAYKLDLVQYSEASRENMQQGTDFGKEAQRLFPGGVEIPYETNQQMLDSTAQLLRDGSSTIYEATFCYNNIVVRADILHRGDAGWEMYEVKKAGKVKPYHLVDLALQYYVLVNCGIPLVKACLILVDWAALKKGASAPEYFAISDQTVIVKQMQERIEEQVPEMRDVLRGEEPLVAKGEQCVIPFECPFNHYCV